jgi:hypothetical protein
MSSMLAAGRAHSFDSIASLTLLLSFLLSCGGGPRNSTIDFTVSASPGAQTIKAGTGATYTVAISPAAMIGAVNLSVSAVPTGVTAYFGADVDVINGAKKLYISTTDTTPAANTRLTVMATDGNGNTHITNVNLTITPAADFAMSASPESETVKPGSSTSYNVNVVFNSSTVGPVSLSTGPLPTGATASFSPSTLNASGNSVLTIDIAPDAPTALTSVNVVGTDSAGSIRVPVGLVISPANFQLSYENGPTIVDAGGTYPAQLGVGGLFFATPGDVTFSATELPTGSAILFDPITVSGQGVSNLTIATDTTIPPGNYTLRFSGTDASGTNSTETPFTVVAGAPGVDTFLGISTQSQSINVPNDAYFQVFVSGPGGAPSSAAVTVTVDKPDVQASLLPSTTQAGLYTLILSTTYPGTTSSSAVATINATDATGTQSMSVVVAIFTQVPPP